MSTGRWVALALATMEIASGCSAKQDRPGTAQAGAEPGIGMLQQGLSVCANGATTNGMDVSYYEGTIDWHAIAASGIKFAFIRVSDGTGVPDTQFDANWSGARAVGIIRGAYQFFRANEDPTAQADLLLSHMGTLSPGDLPPVVDVEVSGGVSTSTLAANLGTWLHVVDSAVGRPSIIYSSSRVWGTLTGDADYSGHPLWVANWSVSCPAVPSPWTGWEFWQTTDSGSVGTISGSVDLDVFNGDLGALYTWAGATSVCGDGVCSGGETSATCPADCPSCGPIPAAGRIVDQTDSCFEPHGPLQYWRIASAGYGGTLDWTHTTSNAAPVNYAVWSLDFLAAGTYHIDAYTDKSYAQSRKAPYSIEHAGSTDRVVLDQTAVDGWNPLGDFHFAPGGRQSVRVDDNSGEASSTSTQLVADALRIVPVTAADGGTDAGTDAGSDGGTDASTCDATCGETCRSIGAASGSCLGGKCQCTGGGTGTDGGADGGSHKPGGARSSPGCGCDGGGSANALSMLLLIMFGALVSRGRRRRL